MLSFIAAENPSLNNTYNATAASNNETILDGFSNINLSNGAGLSDFLSKKTTFEIIKHQFKNQIIITKATTTLLVYHRL